MNAPENKRRRCKRYLTCGCPGCRAYLGDHFDRIVAPIEDELNDREDTVLSEQSDLVRRINAYTRQQFAGATSNDPTELESRERNYRSED